MRDDRERLQDIQDSIDQIEKYAVQGQDRFQADELIQVWIIHYLQIIGEAASKLSDEFVQKHSDIPWAEIVAFRNILVHEYFRVNLRTIWKVVERDLPDLKIKVGKILQENN